MEKITNYKLQTMHPCLKKSQTLNCNVQNYKEYNKALNQLLINPKGGHGLHKDSSRPQTMTAFNEKFLRGGPDASRGQFF